MIGALILGIVAGFLARLIVPGKQAIGFLATIILGLIGAAVGWLVFSKLLGIGDDDAFDLGGLVGAVIGSVIVLLAYLKLENRDGGHSALA
ncbi:MAG: GlsB/YeaQ/YmgE family stress response membrane protein [Solirubrobacterales bacterium]